MLIYWPVGLACVAAMSLVSGLFMAREDRERLGQKTLSVSLGFFMSGLEILGIIRVSDSDLGAHADTPGPLIIACNHPALWDAPLVMRRIGRVICVMKADVQLNPLLRNGSSFAGFVPNAPRLRMIREAVKRLNAGGRLLLFPEGTRTREENGLINDFRPGLALLAKQSGAPVLPVFISSDSPYLRKGWPLWKMAKFPISITIRVGEQISIRPDERVRDFSERLEERFRDELGREPRMDADGRG
jgi:1-acyl-sn-glycerol-3-phosphate acyltransferase